jgi:maltose alpha-D-glucosyltransferase/alpha-amylase
MAFHFPLMPRMFMAIRQEDRHPITEILRQTPDIPPNCQWGLFLRNHDELTLEMVTDEERDYMYQAYAADPRMRINVGIRRRLAPLVENSRRRIELLTALLFSFPGTPVIYYGDEIGMGDNVYLGDRNGVRTPMQWTGDRNAGFSRADPARLFAPLIMDPVYGYQAVNVESQERSPYSLLNWMKRLIALRKQLRVFGRGTLEILPAANRKILAYVRRYEDETVLCVANLARTVQPVELNLSAFKGLTPVELLGLTEFPRIGELPYFLTLPGYTFYWFRLQQAAPPITVQRPLDTTAAAATVAESLPAFFMGVAWDTLLDGNVRTLIEREALAPFLQRQRWYGGKSRALKGARLVDWGVLRRGAHPIFLTIVQADYQDGGRDHFFVPLAILAGGDADAVLAQSPQLALARIAGARKGLLVDGTADDRVALALIDMLDRQETFRTKRAVSRAKRTAAYEGIRGSGPLAPKRRSAEQTNTSLVLGDRVILKLFRRVEPGPNPDVEIGEQLTTRTPFRRAPRVAGALEYEPAGEPIGHLFVVHEFVSSQADGWSHALAELARFYDEVGHRGEPAADLRPSGRLSWAAPSTPRAICELSGGYIDSAQTLGRRTGELHVALASDSASPAFAPEPFTREDVLGIIAGATGELQRARSMVKSEVIDRLEGRLAALRDAKGADMLNPASARIRLHGDYHLGQVLWAESDYYILDFEGEPARPLDERRRKESPLKDVAGMLRSFSYAAYAALFARSDRDSETFSRLEPWARAWIFWTSAAFLRAYASVAGSAPFIPPDPVQRAALLDLFLIEKALYELRYELNTRPEWIRIPMRGLEDLL